MFVKLSLVYICIIEKKTFSVIPFFVHLPQNEFWLSHPVSLGHTQQSCPPWLGHSECLQQCLGKKWQEHLIQRKCTSKKLSSSNCVIFQVILSILYMIKVVKAQELLLNTCFSSNKSSDCQTLAETNSIKFKDGQLTKWRLDIWNIHRLDYS